MQRPCSWREGAGLKGGCVAGVRRGWGVVRGQAQGDGVPLRMKVWAFPQGQWGATAGVRQELAGPSLCHAALPLGEGRGAREQALPASPCSPRSQPWAFSVWGLQGPPESLAVAPGGRGTPAQPLPIPQSIPTAPPLLSRLSCGRLKLVWGLSGPCAQPGEQGEPGWESGHLSSCSGCQNQPQELPAPRAAWGGGALRGELAGGPAGPSPPHPQPTGLDLGRLTLPGQRRACRGQRDPQTRGLGFPQPLLLRGESRAEAHARSLCDLGPAPRCL